MSGPSLNPPASTTPRVSSVHHFWVFHLGNFSASWTLLFSRFDLYQLPLPAAFPSPLGCRSSRSHGFRRASGTIRLSDDSLGFTSPFTSRPIGSFIPAPPENHSEPSWGHVQIFRTVPSAHTLVRWVDELCLRLHSAGSTLSHLWPTGSSTGWPPRLRPGTSPQTLQIPPRGGHPVLRVSSDRT